MAIPHCADWLLQGGLYLHGSGYACLVLCDSHEVSSSSKVTKFHLDLNSSLLVKTHRKGMTVSCI